MSVVGETAMTRLVSVLERFPSSRTRARSTRLGREVHEREVERPLAGRMYFAAIASMCPFTSRPNAFSCNSRSSSASASASRSKLSSGNFASTGAACRPGSRRRRVRRTGSVLQLVRVRREHVSQKVASSISPTPPRALGGRRACSRRPRSAAFWSICAAVPSSLPSRSTIAVSSSWPSLAGEQRRRRAPRAGGRTSCGDAPRNAPPPSRGGFRSARGSSARRRCRRSRRRRPNQG